MEKLQETYTAIVKRMEQIDFGKLWPGFHSFSFGLFDETNACTDGSVMNRPDEFHANTAIEYDGRLLAIWNLIEEDSDIDLLTANIIHEMFHAYQMEQGEKRFGDDLEVMMHPAGQEVLLLKHTENQLLLQSLDNVSVFEHFIQIRRCRRRMSEETVNYELAIETIEGMAEYVGLKALNQIAPEKYQQKVQRHEEKLKNVSHLLDMRKLAYSSGIILLLAAEKQGISVFHRLGLEKRNIFEIISDQVSDESSQILQTYMNEQYCEREKKIRNVLQHSTMMEGSFEIRGYDPMNMFRQGDYIYGKHFWLLWDRTQQKTLSIRGESVLKCDENGKIDKVFS